MLSFEGKAGYSQQRVELVKILKGERPSEVSLGTVSSSAWPVGMPVMRQLEEADGGMGVSP